MSTYKVTGRQTLSPDACQISTELADVQKLMPISDDDRETLRESIKRDGIREPLRGYYSQDGEFQILSGVNRLEIARELKLPLVPVEVVEIPQADREAFAEDENLARRQLNTQAKKALASRRLLKNPKLSDRQIGARYGLDNKTVAVVRAELVRGEEIPHVTERTGKDGKKQPANKHKPSKNTPPKATGKPESSTTGQSRGQGKGGGDAALMAFNSALNDALRKVEMQSASVLKVAVRHAKSWLKDVERKQRSAEAIEKRSK